MWQSIFHFPLFPWLHFVQRGKFQSLALQTLFTGSHKTPRSQSPPPHSDLFSLVCPLWRSGVSAMQGARQSALYFTSLPNTFPFTLALSICHWGLPHGVDHVSRWWSRLSCSLLALSYFTPFYGLLQEKRCLTFSFFFFFSQRRACSCICLSSSARPGGCIAVCTVVLYSRIPPPRPLRVLQLPFRAASDPYQWWIRIRIHPSSSRRVMTQ